MKKRILSVVLILSLLVALPPLFLLSANAAVIGDDYPAKWKDVPQDSMFDDWGMYNRECVSFVAWRLYSQNGYSLNRAGKS